MNRFDNLKRSKDNNASRAAPATKRLINCSLNAAYTMNLLFLYGPPAVGKYSVGRKIADHTDFKLFHNHLTVDLVASLFKFGSKEYSDTLTRLRLFCLRAAAQSGLKGVIFTFCYEGPADDHFVNECREIVAQGGGTVVFVRLHADQEELDRRVVSRERKNFGKIASPELLREVMATWEVSKNIPDTQTIIINTSDLSVDEVASLVLATTPLGKEMENG